MTPGRPGAARNAGSASARAAKAASLGNPGIATTSGGHARRSPRQAAAMSAWPSDASNQPSGASASSADRPARLAHNPVAPAFAALARPAELGVRNGLHRLLHGGQRRAERAERGEALRPRGADRGKAHRQIFQNDAGFTSALPSSAISDGAFNIGLKREKASMWQNLERSACARTKRRRSASPPRRGAHRGDRRKIRIRS